MPCRLEPWEVEYENARIAGRLAFQIEAKRAAAEAEHEAVISQLSAKIDHLRDVIWYLVNDPNVVESEVEQILADQERHRQDDLNRLLATKGFKRGAKHQLVLAADPSYPLEPQLGFNPDDF